MAEEGVAGNHIYMQDIFVRLSTVRQLKDLDIAAKEEFIGCYLNEHEYGNII